jgi:hypothetical protein
MSNDSEMNRLNRAVMSAFELSDVDTTEMNGGGSYNDEISEFITKLSDFYTKKSETNNVSGGYSGSRNIRSESMHNIFGGKKDNSSESDSIELNGSSSESSSLMGSNSSDSSLDLNKSSSSSSSSSNKKPKKSHSNLTSTLNRVRNHETDEKYRSSDNKSKKSHSNLTSVLDRVRNPEADEKYRSFVKTIMDLLSVDEDTARLYRSAIKITIERKNPELRKDELLKIKEMENIFKSESTLTSTLEKIDIDEIKKHMAMQKQRSEERRKEFGQSTTENNKTVSAKKNDNETKNKKNNDNEPKDKKKKQKRVNAARVASNGYLVSSEFILSSE